MLVCVIPDSDYSLWLSDAICHKCPTLTANRYGMKRAAGPL